MDAFRPPPSIEVRESAHHGLGVHARAPIAEGELIERAPVVLLSPQEAAACPTVGRNCFVWSDTEVALTMGYGSFYNHSYEPNAEYDDVRGPAKLFRALRDIQAGEEITVNYNGDPGDLGPVGFEPS